VPSTARLDISSIKRLASQVVPNKSSNFVDCYLDATSVPYSFNAGLFHVLDDVFEPLLMYVALIAYFTPDIQSESLNGYNISSVEEDCIKCVGNNSRKLFIKELWFAGASSPIYN
jgi:hypothetical protein